MKRVCLFVYQVYSYIILTTMGMLAVLSLYLFISFIASCELISAQNVIKWGQPLDIAAIILFITYSIFYHLVITKHLTEEVDKTYICKCQIRYFPYFFFILLLLTAGIFNYRRWKNLYTFQDVHLLLTAMLCYLVGAFLCMFHRVKIKIRVQ